MEAKIVREIWAESSGQEYWLGGGNRSSRSKGDDVEAMLRRGWIDDER